MLQKLSGRTVSPGLQMFGQSISGNVDMDGNGYAGTLRPRFRPDFIQRRRPENTRHQIRKAFKYFVFSSPSVFLILLLSVAMAVLQLVIEAFC